MKKILFLHGFYASGQDESAFQAVSHFPDSNIALMCNNRAPIGAKNPRIRGLGMAREKTNVFSL